MDFELDELLKEALKVGRGVVAAGEKQLAEMEKDGVGNAAQIAFLKLALGHDKKMVETAND